MVTSEWIHGQHELPHIIRRQVFMEELGQSAEADVFDEYAMHVVMYDDNTPCATGRIYHDGKHFRMDKICVLKEYRGRKIADLMVRLMLYKAVQFAPELRVLTCQNLIGFFGKFGFKPLGDEIICENIPHVEMSLLKDELVFPSDCGRK